METYVELLQREIQEYRLELARLNQEVGFSKESMRKMVLLLEAEGYGDNSTVKVSKDFLIDSKKVLAG